MKKVEILIRTGNGNLLATYAHEDLQQSLREAKADNPEHPVQRRRTRRGRK